MCKYGDLTPDELTYKDRRHYEGYMQMSKRNPTPYRELNEKKKQDKSVLNTPEQQKLVLHPDKTLEDLEMANKSTLRKPLN